MPAEKVVFDREDIGRTLVRIAHEIVERNPAGDELAIVGIHRRGAPLAARIRDLVADLVHADVPLGDLDISFYRDDVLLRAGEPAATAATTAGQSGWAGDAAGALPRRGYAPVVNASHLDFPIDGRTVVIVDDVLYTGRTARAAIEALFDYGRPARVQLAALADRGHRELPIRPDYVGKNLPTSREERVNVCVAEIDGLDQVTIASPPGERG